MLLSFLCYDFMFTKTKSKMIRLDSGYYKFEVIGATGGTGCRNSKQNTIPGGNGAKITGIFQIKANHDIQCLAGSKPATNCKASFEKGDEEGSGGDSGDVTAGAGGGFSAFWVAGTLSAIAGGGGGAGFYVPGIPAGGVGYQYSYKNGCSDLTLIKKPVGDNFPVDLSWFGENAKPPVGDGTLRGAGGGGGAVKGSAGHPISPGSDLFKCLQPGTGGSSYVNTNFNQLRDLRVMDGKEAPLHNGDGVIGITNITLCAAHCVDCDIETGRVCHTCENRYYLFQNTCYDSCSHTPVATYKDESSKKCINCMPHCKSCKSSSVCDVCEDGYNGTACTKIPDPTSSKIPDPTSSKIPDPTAKAIEPGQSDKNVPSKDISIDIDGGGVNQNSGDTIPNPLDDDKNIPWWIIAVVVGGIVLIAVIIGSIVCAKRKREDSVDMDQEEAVNYPQDPTTPVETSNPLYSREGEDPFQNDFNSDDSRGGVFKQGDIEEMDP